MVLEIALIKVRDGHEDEFAAAYRKARQFLVTTPGCQSVRMMQSVETPARFALLVEWESVAAHMDNFQGTERFTRWRELVEEHFDGDAQMQHFTLVEP